MKWIYSCPDSAPDGGKWSASHLGHFSPGKDPPAPFKKEAGWM